MNDPITLPLETLLDTLPITGVWTLQKTNDADPGKRYVVTWCEKIKNRNHAITRHGPTARMAVAKLLIEIKGLITDRDEYEPD